MGPPTSSDSDIEARMNGGRPTAPSFILERSLGPATLHSVRTASLTLVFSLTLIVSLTLVVSHTSTVDIDKKDRSRVCTVVQHDFNDRAQIASKEPNSEPEKIEARYFHAAPVNENSPLSIVGTRVTRVLK